MPAKKRRPQRQLLTKVPNYYGLKPDGKKYAPQELYVATRSAFWWDKGMRYVRAYYELLDLYIVRRGDLAPLLGTEHVGLWLKGVRLLQIGKTFTLEELADDLVIGRRALRDRFNRLADVKLIHFERCYCQGRPVDVVFHTPLRAAKLTPTVHAELLQRCGTAKLPGYTQRMREKLGQDWPGRWREVQDMMPGTADERQRARRAIYYLCHVEMEETDGAGFNAPHFVKEFKTLCTYEKLQYDDRHIRAALVMWKQFREGEFTDDEYKRADRILKKGKK
jgi:hypothetical protein